MTANEIKQALLQRVEELAAFLFPAGTRVGNNWCVGSISGEAGQSFKICLSGEHIGRWGDFDGAQPRSRNLLDLWIAKRGVNFVSAMRECTQWLGSNFELQRYGNAQAATNSIQALPPFDWDSCVNSFGDGHREWLAKWRGYCAAFCLWLHTRRLVGVYQGNIAFPVHAETGEVVGAHYRTKAGSWFYTKGSNARPLVVGSLTQARRVHVFESQWDAFAVYDKLRLFDHEQDVLIVTRGAGNGKKVPSIPPRAEVFAWKQNDDDANGRKADGWMMDVVNTIAAPVRSVITPPQFKDVNEWTTEGGAGYNELTSALAEATVIQRPASRTTVEVDSLISPVSVSALQDAFPNPPRPEAFHGLAGKIVRLIEPHTEADPVALLGQLLAAVGNVLGHDQYIVADGARHYLNFYEVLVGESSKGRKGTSWNHIGNLLERVDSDWRKDRVASGLSSGEGFIWAVHDEIEETKPIREKGRSTGEYETIIADQGEDDKRLFVIEGEFANVLKVMGREGNTLSPIIRSAWDSGDLRTMVKNAPAKATGAHISIIGHITKDELRRLLTQTESANGFANRFLWLGVRRSKCLPDGGALELASLDGVVEELLSVINFAKDVVEIRRDPEARKLWHEVYPRLSAAQPGMSGAVIGRAEAQVTRLSAMYALLDRSRYIRPEHHEAAMAFWDYCERSAKWIFGTGTGDRNADKILRSLRHAPNGMTRTEISTLVFNKHVSSGDIDEALRMLLGLDMVYSRIEQTGGAPAERWFIADVAK